MFHKYLHLTNFKSIRDARFDFRKINVFAGGNGNGKSSIIEPLAYLWTNKLSENLEHYVRWGESSYRIASEFSIGSDTFDMEVKYDGNTHKRLLATCDGETSSISGSDQVASFLAEYINAPLAYFSSVSMQGESMNVLAPGVDRLSKLKTILDIDRATRMADAMGLDIVELTDKVKLLKTQLEIYKSTTYTSVNAIKPPDPVELENELERLEGLKVQYESSLENYYDIESKHKLYLDKATQISKYDSDLKLTKNDIVEIETSIMSLQEVSVDVETLNTFSKDLEKINADYLQISQTLKTKTYLESSLAKLQSDIQAKVRDYDIYPLKRLPVAPYTDKDLADAQDKHTKLLSELFLREKDVSLAKEGKCHECRQPFHGDLIDLQGKVDAVKSYVQETVTKIDTIRVALKNYEDLKKSAEFNKSMRASLDTQLAKLQKDYEDLSKEGCYDPNEWNAKIVPLKERVVFLQAELDRKNTIEKNRQALLIKKEASYNQIKKLEETLATLTLMPEPVRIPKPVFAEESQMNDVKKSLNIYTTQLKQYQDNLAYNETIYEKRRINEKNIVDTQKSIDENAHRLTQLKHIKSFLNNTASHELLREGISDIVKIMNEIFSKAYGRYEIDFKTEKKTADFYYRTPGMTHSAPIGVASGFEKQIMALSLKGALTYLSGTRILSLDEVDSDSSEENSMKLFSTFLSLNFFDQIHIITHKPATIEMLQNDYDARIFNLQMGEITSVIN